MYIKLRCALNPMLLFGDIQCNPPAPELLQSRYILGILLSLKTGLRGSQVEINELHTFIAVLQYAQDTQHEKILRGLAVGIALTTYGRLEEADTLIETLCRDKDPILRWSGKKQLKYFFYISVKDCFSIICNCHLHNIQGDYTLNTLLCIY